MAGLPKWLRDQFLLEDAIGFGTAPSVDHIVRRAGGVSSQQTPEDFLRALMADARRAEEAAAQSVDAAAEGGLNMFGNRPRTLAQSRADAMKQFPGFDNLSIEDAALLMNAINKGAVLKGMPVFGDQGVMGRAASGTRPAQAYQPADRLDAIVGPRLFGMYDDPTAADVMASLGNKAEYIRATGLRNAADLPPPPAFTRSSGPDGMEVVPSEALQVVGDDVATLARTLRGDQIKSRLMQAQDAMDEMNLIQTQNEMAKAADAVAAQEAYARQFGGFDPQTRRQMDRSIRRDQMERSGTLSKLTNDPLHDLKYERPPESWEITERWNREDAQESSDILKGFWLGHVLSYPAIYGAYRYSQGDWPFNSTAQEPKMPPAVHLGAEGSKEDEAFLAVADSLPKIPVETPDMPVIRTPETAVGIPEDNTLAIDDMGGDAELAAESSPPPTIEDLDAELRARGFQGVPSWYIRAMKDPSVKLIDGMPKEQFLPFSSKSKEYPIQQQFVMQGMTR